MTCSKRIDVPVGGIWEEESWRIEVDMELDVTHLKCPHVIPGGKHGICPRIVIATNEGGSNCTGVCLDCILEAAKTLPKMEDPVEVIRERLKHLLRNQVHSGPTHELERWCLLMAKSACLLAGISEEDVRAEIQSCLDALRTTEENKQHG